MTTNITVKTKIRVNGHDYTSADSMPPDVRQAYERALAAVSRGERGTLNTVGEGTPGSAQTVMSTKIIFNGQEYGSVEQMPAGVRRLYDDVLATLDAKEPAQRWSTDCDRPTAASPVVLSIVRPESTGSRLIIAGVVIAALLLASFVFGR